MNILLYFSNQLNPQRGGTERVACLLADYFLSRGHVVKYMASRNVDHPESRESVFLPAGDESTCRENIDFLLDYIKRNEIDIIINEGASTESIYLFSHEYIPLSVKLISHVHFDITGDLEHLGRTQFLPLSGVPLATSVKNLLKRIKLPFNKRRGYRWKKQHFGYMYDNSDAIVVLSEKQKEKLSRLLGIKDSNRIYGLTNPNTVNTEIFDFKKKGNEILYVGRLDYGQKRVDRILRVWKLIQHRLPQWHLTIAGFGPFKEYYEAMSRELHLERIDFVGQVDTSNYYKQSKIFLMTSNYEGTPMVIPECMSHGVVPVVMNNFVDADMYIKDGENGFLTTPFSIVAMAKVTLDLAHMDRSSFERLATVARNTIATTDNNAILRNWDNLFKDLSD
ncbi:MAG: glycosyltransferase family 4 protein [Bacteroidales bacterium]|nr:glycosyltransferase family 4 protein [Bacteroidales bacterium]